MAVDYRFYDSLFNGLHQLVFDCQVNLDLSASNWSFAVFTNRIQVYTTVKNVERIS